MSPNRAFHACAAFLAALLLSVAAWAQSPAPAPKASDPPAWAEASERPQYASVPGVETNRLIQGAGREWRALRNGPLTQYGGWLIAVVLGALAAFHLVKGPVRMKLAPTGRRIERFDLVERTVHWVMAASFVVLALSGIVILWGKHLILPWLGYTGFSWLTVACKSLHNFVGPLFVVATLLAFLVYVKDNIVRARDLRWLVKLGGLVGKEEIPSGRFNGGQKAWFWGGLVLLGFVLGVTGLILDFPNLQQGRETMQLANLIHGVAAALFIAGALGHIYMGTIGTEGAWAAMSTGYVDEAWAEQHHALWLRDVKRGQDEKGRGIAPRPVGTAAVPSGD